MLATRFPALLPLLALLAALPACGSCGDQPSQSVTFRIRNKLAWDIFVRDEANQLGMGVQRNSSSEWVDMAEAATCACQECSAACDGTCDCQVDTWAHRIQSGATADRTWSGDYRPDDHVNCYSGEVKSCLATRLSAQPNTYRLQLCWASSVPNAPVGRERFPSAFPTDPKLLSCVTRTFDLPADGVVEIATDAPAGCRGPSDCASDQMCLSGRCSSTCTPNGVPKLGGEWTLEVGAPDDAGFFTVTTSGATRTMKGTGKVATVRYSAGTTNLTVTRLDAQGLDYTASLYYTLPAKRALPLTVGDEVSLTLVEFPSGDRKPARAFTLRRNGALALVADNGYGGFVLDAAATAPFTATTGDLFACDVADCGKRFHHRLQVATTGTAHDSAIDLDAGGAATLKVGQDTWEAVNVANYANEVDGCGPSPMTPYLLMIQP